MRTNTKKSCGCLHDRGAVHHLPGKATTKALFKEKARQLVAGLWWLAPREAKRYLSVSLPTLWKRVDTKGMRTLKLTDANGRTFNYIAEEDVIAAIASKGTGGQPNGQAVDAGVRVVKSKRSRGRPPWTEDPETVATYTRVADALKGKKFDTIAAMARHFDIDRRRVYEIKAHFHV